MALPLAHSWPEPPESPKRLTPRPPFSRLDHREKQLLATAAVVIAGVSEGAMSFLDHLDELRTRLIVALVALLVGFLIAFAFVSQIFTFMMQPLLETLPEGSTLVYTEPAEHFLLNIRMAALAGIFIASPVVLWQVWLFVAPGLYVHEKKFAIPFVVLSSMCFVGGGLFSHFIAFPTLLPSSDRSRPTPWSFCLASHRSSRCTPRCSWRLASCSRCRRCRSSSHGSGF